MSKSDDPMDSQFNQQLHRPMPLMPSQLFQQLTLSQLELLAGSILAPNGKPKIKSMALYLPQENTRSGQLEFLPAVIFPHPSSERVFIANQAESGVAPRLPPTLTTLPGFAHAVSLLPDYPMVSSSTEAGIGVVEEVFCEVGGGGAALSVPLFSGSSTVGVLLASPSAPSETGGEVVWTTKDRVQVSRAAQSLSLALSMDTEKSVLQRKHKQVQEALSDSLHQVKNPLQALRTFGKLLQQRIADTEDMGIASGPQLLELVDHLMVQSDRLTDRLKPVDEILDSLSERPLLLPYVDTSDTLGFESEFQIPLLPAQDEILEFGQGEEAQSDSLRAGTLEFSNDVEEFSARQRAPPQLKQQSARQLAPSSTLSVQRRIEVSGGGSGLELAFVDDILAPIFSAFEAIAKDSEIEFEVVVAEELPGTLIMVDALQESVTNLLDNAFKYVKIPKDASQSNQNNFPKVRARLMPTPPESSRGVTILIEDNGPGIPPWEREMVFARGCRGQATLQLDGSGIGLDIARGLMNKMGGILRLAQDGKYADVLDGTVMEIQVYRKPT